jgi:hypothetical protein
MSAFGGKADMNFFGKSLVATHLSFPSVCHVAIDGDVFLWVPGPWEY